MEMKLKVFYFIFNDNDNKFLGEYAGKCGSKRAWDYYYYFLKCKNNPLSFCRFHFSFLTLLSFISIL